MPIPGPILSIFATSRFTKKSEINAVVDEIGAILRLWF